MKFTDIPELPNAKPPNSRERFAFIERISNEVGDWARMKTFSTPILLVNHPRLLHELLVEKVKAFEKSYLLRFALYPLAGEGLFTSRPPLWRRQRKLMAPMFHATQLTSYANDMVTAANRTIETWKDGQELALLTETTHIAMSVAGKTLFNAESFSEADEVGRALNTTLEWTSENAPSPLALAHIIPRVMLERFADAGAPSVLAGAARGLAEKLHGPVFVPGAEGRKLRAAVSLLDNHVADMIRERRESAEPKADLLSRLLEARDDETGEGMSDQQIRDEVLTLFVAGHETTATGLAWVIYLLCRHPEIYQALEAEVDAVGPNPTVADLPRLALALRVFKEALRLYPPVFVFARQAIEDSELGGAPIAKHMPIMVPVYAIHRKREFWPDPHTFDPNRFLPENEAARHKLAWMPFGAGPRVCIGNHFAMMEAQLVLCRMLYHARFESLGDERPAPFATLRPENGVRVRVSLRKHERPSRP